MKLYDALTIPKESFPGQIIPARSLLKFIDNDSPILAVAHLDSVMWAPPIKHGTLVIAPQLDDRLGAWVCMNLERWGIDADILFTDDEEIGWSTASYFKPQKQYNWIVEFDRAGTDVVLYHRHNQEYIDLLAEFEFSIGYGSYSDICDMDIGCFGFNVGIGYHKQHTRYCYADIDDTMWAVERFAEFYDCMKDSFLPDCVNTDSWSDVDYLEDERIRLGYHSVDEMLMFRG